MRRLLLLSPLLAAAALSGCAARPGTAVDVAGTTISTDRVDDVTLAYCDAVTQAKLGEFPLGLIRGQVVEQLTERALVTDFAADHGVTSSTAYNQAVSGLRSQLASFSDESRQAIVDVEGAATYGGALLLEVGKKLSPGASDADAAAAAQDEFASWVKGRSIDANPVYGLDLSEVTYTLAPSQSGDGYQLQAAGGAGTLVDPSISLAVSDAAKAAVTALQPSATGSSDAADLPQSQRCG